MIVSPDSVLRRYLVDGWGRADVAVLRSLLAPDVVDVSHPAASGTSEAEALIERMLASWTILSDQRWRVDEVFVSGEKAIAISTVAGRHTGEILGVAPTGSSVTVRTVDWIRVQAGCIVEVGGVSYLVSLLRQLGVAAARTPADPSRDVS